MKNLKENELSERLANLKRGNFDKYKNVNESIERRGSGPKEPGSKKRIGNELESKWSKRNGYWSCRWKKILEELKRNEPRWWLWPMLLPQLLCSPHPPNLNSFEQVWKSKAYLQATRSFSVSPSRMRPHRTASTNYSTRQETTNRWIRTLSSTLDWISALIWSRTTKDEWRSTSQH